MRPISSGSHAHARRCFPTPKTGSGSHAPKTGSGSPAPSTGSSTPTPSTGSSTPTPSTGSGTAAPRSGKGASSLLSRLTTHQNNQFNRIQKGISNGTLTPEEAKGLAQKQSAIAQAEMQALSDGKLDKKEFKQLRKMQREASRDIFEQKHNSTEQPVAEGDRASHLEGFQTNQSGRVRNGLADGSLTTGEAGGLMDQLNRISETKGKAMADGKIDETEYNQLRQLQREADLSIFNARHNSGIRA